MKLKTKGKQFLASALTLCVLTGMCAGFGAAPVKAAVRVTPMVKTSDRFSLALAADGILWAWGQNEYGQLGDGTTEVRQTPVRAQGVKGKTIAAIELGNEHTVALALDGTLWTWGRNNLGQLGDGTATNRFTPVQVKGLDEKTVTAIAAGYSHTVALTSDGTLWAWGSNEYGQLGNGTTINSSMPVKVKGLEGKTITSIAAGSGHTLALASDNTLWAWGFNRYGQLGDGTTDNKSTPVQVTGLEGKTITSVVTNSMRTTVLAADNTLWAWGYNVYNQLSDGTTGNESTPVPVATPAGKTITLIADGGGHMVALASDNTLWSWGGNSYGELGNSMMEPSTTPVQSASNLADKTVIAITAGNGHTIVLTSDKYLWAWGTNYYYQSGFGSNYESPSPTQVVGENWKGYLNLKESSDDRDAAVTAYATVPEPAYMVTIPAVVDLGDLLKKQPSSSDKIKTTEFTISATEISSVFGGKKITASISSDFELTEIGGDTRLTYEVYSDPVGIPLENNSLFTEFTKAANKTGFIKVDQSQIEKAASYTGTMTFTIGLADLNDERKAA